MSFIQKVVIDLLFVFVVISAFNYVKAEEVVSQETKQEQFCKLASEDLDEKTKSDYYQLCMSVDEQHQYDISLMDFIYAFSTNEQK